MFPALRSLTYFTFSSAYRRVSHATHAYRREPLTHPARLSLTPHLRTAHFRLAHAHVLIPHTPFFHFFSMIILVHGSSKGLFCGPLQFEGVVLWSISGLFILFQFFQFF